MSEQQDGTDWQQADRVIPTWQILDWLKDMDRIVSFFEERDRMNADLHCEEVRWSPLTELARNCRMTIANLPEQRPR